MNLPVNATFRILTLGSALACTTGAIAASPTTSVTIYSSAQPGSLNASMFRSGGEWGSVPGYAVVRQEREVGTTKGRSIVRINDVAANIDPTTVSFESLSEPNGTRVIEQSFEFDLTSTRKLLEKYLDREVSVEQIRGNTVETVTGLLQSARDGIVIKQADGSLRTLTNYAGVRLASLPGGLISKPTLVWDLASDRTATQRVRVSYQTTGITWWTDYNVTLNDEQGCKLDLGAWVTIVNQAGTTFDSAKLKLVAGEVQRAEMPRPTARGAVAEQMVMSEPKVAGFAEKSFFEYRLYTLGRPTTIANNATKQIELFPAARDVSCEKRLVYAGQGNVGFYGGLVTERNVGGGNKKVDAFLRFKNAETNRLGIPLPAGKIRVSKLDSADQSLEFIGEDLIDHTPKNETIQLRLGSAFDVVGERRQVDYRIDTKAKWIEEEIEVRVRNQKSEPVTVLVRETMMRWSNWSVSQKSTDFKKLDAQTIEFPVKIAKEGEAVVRYTVRYSW